MLISNKRLTTKYYLLILIIILTLLTMISINAYKNSAPFGTVSHEFLPAASIVSSVYKITPATNLSSAKIFCWITTTSKFHTSKALVVKQTWAKRCDKYVFMSDEENTDLPAINLNTSKGHDALWNKTKAALTHIYERYYNEYDWFLKADDDTYVIVENLRKFLLTQNAENALYFGCIINGPTAGGYMSGGAGYVLSRIALQKFVTEALKSPEKCPTDAPHEDIAVAQCLETVGVLASDSRDQYGRHRFLPLQLEKILSWPDGDNGLEWFKQYSKYNMKENTNVVSNDLITVHYVEPEMIRLLDFIIYNISRDRYN